MIFSNFENSNYRSFYSKSGKVEKRKKSVVNEKAFGVLLTDSSKGFDCLDPEFLIAKLNAYDFSLLASKLIQDYLSNRKQQVKINSSYSSCREIILGVTRGLILGALLFNIIFIDLFFIIKDFDIANYADDNTPYLSANNKDGVVKSLEEASTKACNT